MSSDQNKADDHRDFSNDPLLKNESIVDKPNPVIENQALKEAAQEIVLTDKPGLSSKAKPDASSQVNSAKEINGPKGLEPTRYGDWESKGRCHDF